MGLRTGEEGTDSAVSAAIIWNISWETYEVIRTRKEDTRGGVGGARDETISYLSLAATGLLHMVTILGG